MKNITTRGQLARDDSNFPVGWDYNHISAATGTTLVKGNPGVLHTVTFNNPVATSVVTIYDSTSTASPTTPIAEITVPASPMPVTLTYDAAMNTGIVVKVATAGSDITVNYI